MAEVLDETDQEKQFLCGIGPLEMHFSRLLVVRPRAGI